MRGGRRGPLTGLPSSQVLRAILAADLQGLLAAHDAAQVGGCTQAATTVLGSACLADGTQHAWRQPAHALEVTSLHALRPSMALALVPVPAARLSGGAGVMVQSAGSGAADAELAN